MNKESKKVLETTLIHVHNESHAKTWRTLSRLLRRVTFIFSFLFFCYFIFFIYAEPDREENLKLPSKPLSTNFSSSVSSSSLLLFSFNSPQKEIYEKSNWNSYIELGNLTSTSIFPKNEIITLTNADHVKKRGKNIKNLFTCYGKKKENNFNESIYDFVILPIGCFGDPLSLCTSCTLIKTLINITYCGNKKIGLFLGDNFYPYGITSWKDKRFNKELYFKFFRFPELQMNYYVTSGNHDKYPKFLYRNDLYWKLPFPYYRSGILQSGETNLEIFVFSTNPYELRSKNFFFTSQVNWLNISLANSTAKWKIVMTHEPIFNIINLSYNKKLIEKIHPLLINYGVQLLVCAHLHGVFLHRVEGGYYQLISAGFANDLIKNINFYRPMGYNHFGVGATSLLIKKDYLIVIAMDSKGNLIFQHKIPNLRNLKE